MDSSRVFVVLGMALGLVAAPARAQAPVAPAPTPRTFTSPTQKDEPPPPPVPGVPVDPIPVPPQLPPPQPRDYFLNPPKKGTWATFDAYTVGVQANLERRFIIQREDYGAFTPRFGTVASLGYGEVGGHADLRFLFFNVGVSGGVRRVWRNYAFPQGVEGTRERRTAIDDSPTPYDPANWAFGEGRIRMVLPVADWITAATTATVRYEACPDNSFDWFHTTMHDGGFLVKYEASVLFRSPRLGAIGPSFRAMTLPRNGTYESELAVGFTAGRRLGLMKQNDLVLLNVLTRPGDPSFGFQLLKMPVFALLAYRVSFQL